MTIIARTAQRGDICVLLVPSLSEEASLRRYHAQIQAVFGGRPCKTPHVTCQRFAMTANTDARRVLKALREAFSTLKSFPLFAESLTSFYADFWHCTVLRWKIQNTSSWERFKWVVENTLTSQDCPPHYPPTQAITATALESISEVKATSAFSELLFPRFLFNVQHIMLSQIQDANRYKILARYHLSHADSSVVKDPIHFGTCLANGQAKTT